MIIATTTTARILLLELNASVMLDGTAFTMVARGLKASMVDASATSLLGRVTLNAPRDFTPYAIKFEKNAPHT